MTTQCPYCIEIHGKKAKAAGCTEAEIATITGHSLRDVRSILDAHYLHRDVEMARTAIHKLEMGYARTQETA